MKKKLSVGLVICLGLLLLTVLAYAVAAQLGLNDYFGTVYGKKPMPADVMNQAAESFEPQAYTLGPVNFTLNELVADGRWIYASVTITASDPDKYLIMPTSGDVTDPISAAMGGTDDRTWVEAACEDGKILAVGGIYLEYDQQGDYMMDHMINEDGSIAFVIGGEMKAEAGQTVDLSVLTLTRSYDTTHGPVDPEKLQTIENSDQRESHALTVQILPSVQTRRYAVNLPLEGTDATVESVTLTQTALCTYVDMTLNSETKSQVWCTLVDEEGNELPSGSAVSSGTYDLSELPDELHVRFDVYKAEDMATFGPVTIKAE